MINPNDNKASDAIVLGERAKNADETRWGMLLVLFMRINAGIMSGCDDHPGIVDSDRRCQDKWRRRNKAV